MIRCWKCGGDSYIYKELGGNIVKDRDFWMIFFKCSECGYVFSISPTGVPKKSSSLLNIICGVSKL